MNKIFRFVGISTILAGIFALGAVAALAQDPCADVDGQNDLYQNKILPFYKENKDPDVLQKAVDAANQFLEKYGSCEPAKPQTEWMQPTLRLWGDKVIDT